MPRSCVDGVASGRSLAALVCVLVVAMGAIEGVRAAQDQPQLSGKAAQLYEKGRALYAEGDYESAARKLRRAYEHNDHPLLSYNVALAEWRAGRFQRALEWARRDDVAGLPESVAAKHRALVRGLETRVASVSAAERIAAATEVASAGTSSPPSDEAGEAAGASAGGFWTGVGLVGAGVVSLGGSLWLDGRLGQNFEDYQRAARRGNAETYRRLESTIERQQRVAIALLGLGVASTAAGGYLLVRSGFSPFAKSKGPGRWRLAPVVGVETGYIGVSVRIGGSGAP